MEGRNVKVGDLISKLQKLDPTHDIFCFAEDIALGTADYCTRLLEIENITEIEGEVIRQDDGLVSMKLGKGANSRKLSIIEITSDI
jgi:hypothetical protein